jgi:hypothetical protein
MTPGRQSGPTSDQRLQFFARQAFAFAYGCARALIQAVDQL